MNRKENHFWIWREERKVEEPINKLRMLLICILSWLEHFIFLHGQEWISWLFSYARNQWIHRHLLKTNLKFKNKCTVEDGGIEGPLFLVQIYDLFPTSIGLLFLEKFLFEKIDVKLRFVCEITSDVESFIRGELPFNSK